MSGAVFSEATRRVRIDYGRSMQGVGQAQTRNEAARMMTGHARSLFDQGFRTAEPVTMRIEPNPALGDILHWSFELWLSREAGDDQTLTSFDNAADLADWVGARVHSVSPAPSVSAERVL